MGLEKEESEKGVVDTDLLLAAIDQLCEEVNKNKKDYVG